MKVGGLPPPSFFSLFSFLPLSLSPGDIATLVYWTAGKIKRKVCQLKVCTDQ